MAAWPKQDCRRHALPLAAAGDLHRQFHRRRRRQDADRDRRRRVLLKAAGERPCFLTRGYGGKSEGPLLVTEDHDAAEVGDETLLLRAHAPVVVAADRAAGAKLIEGTDATVIVMDDGFQNPGLAKDLSLIVADAATGIGNGLVMPAGPLRAPLEPQLDRADALLLIGDGGKGTPSPRPSRPRASPCSRRASCRKAIRAGSGCCR